MNTESSNNTDAEAQAGRKRSIQRPRVHTEVLSCLLDDIQSGVYQVGQKLPSERELMDEFGVGRPAVREALSGLARMGLIEVSPGMRARVCRLTLKPLLREMRATLEIYSSSADGWRQLHDLRLFFETAVVRRMALDVECQHVVHPRPTLKPEVSCQEPCEDANNCSDASIWASWLSFSMSGCTFRRMPTRSMPS